jgi:hypothetical protein
MTNYKKILCALPSFAIQCEGFLFYHNDTSFWQNIYAFSFNVYSFLYVSNDSQNKMQIFV